MDWRRRLRYEWGYRCGEQQSLQLDWLGEMAKLRILSNGELSARQFPTKADSEIPQCKLIVEGKESPTILSGAILEAAVRWNGYYFLFFTDDIPEEDMLSMYFLDSNFRPLDTATLGGAYSTGNFRNLRLIEPNILTFRFIGGTDWKIELFETPEYFLPFFAEPRGVTRKLTLKRYFKIFGNPKPEA